MLEVCVKSLCLPFVYQRKQWLCSHRLSCHVRVTVLSTSICMKAAVSENNVNPAVADCDRVVQIPLETSQTSTFRRNQAASPAVSWVRPCCFELNANVSMLPCLQKQ